MAISGFKNREEAGYRLGRMLADWNLHTPVVIAIPRGGVPVAEAIADVLHAQLDTAPEPGQLNSDAKIFSNITSDHAQYEENVDPRDRDVIIVDDVAIRGTLAAQAAQRFLALGAKRVIVACPLASREAVQGFEAVHAETCLIHVTEGPPNADDYYEDFSPVQDQRVRDIKARLQEGINAPTFFVHDIDTPNEVLIDLSSDGNKLVVPGTLTLPKGTKGIVIFAHGSGSSRHSPRNQRVARSLQEAGFGTLLMDLLTEEEAQSRSFVFDVHLLAQRLRRTVAWLRTHNDTKNVGIAFFGASTGAAAALEAAASIPEQIRAVVSRGGRPDLAVDFLERVAAPTLFIVGGDDEPVTTWNREAYQLLNSEKKFSTVAGATHLFEEPGALDEVVRLASDWFHRYLVPVNVRHAPSLGDQSSGLR